MNLTYRRRRAAGKARQMAFLIATVFYALLTVGQLGAIVEGLVGIVPGLVLCILWSFGAAGCCLAAGPVLEGGEAL